MAAHKLDIFETLVAIDQRDLSYLDRLPAEARSGFAPPVVLRWASSAPDGPAADAMLIRINERANRNFYDLSDHPELQYALIASCGSGRRMRHQWIAAPGRKKSASGLHQFLSKYWPDANDTELDIIVGQFTRDSYVEFVYGCGLDPKETKASIELYEKFTGTGAKRGSSKKAKSKV